MDYKIMKKLLALILTSTILVGALCSCSTNDVTSPASSIEENQQTYSAKITSEDIDGKTSLEIAYEYVDGKDSVEIYYISFGCDVDGLSLERIDENGEVTETLYSTETITTEQCFKLTTTVPEGYPNSRITVVCGENEYRYQISYNGRDGGANLIEC